MVATGPLVPLPHLPALPLALMHRILVVDDCPVDRTLISGLLARQSDWSVEVVNDGQAALQCLEQGRVDLVLTDLQMPNLDGLELVKRIRKQFNHVPVVLITAYGSEETSLEALRAGAANYSHKSSLSRDLVPTLQNVLEFSGHIQRSNRQSLDQPGSCHAFVLDNDFGQVGRVIESLDSHLPNWADPDRLRVSMALHEAITNAICHGNLEIESKLRERQDDSALLNEWKSRKEAEPYCARRIRIQADFSDREIRFRIADDGPGFDPAGIADPTCEDNLMRPHGRGLLLIRSFMDEVQHNREGNQITLVKRRPGEPG